MDKFYGITFVHAPTTDMYQYINTAPTCGLFEPDTHAVVGVLFPPLK